MMYLGKKQMVDLKHSLAAEGKELMACAFGIITSIRSAFIKLQSFLRLVQFFLTLVDCN